MPVAVDIETEEDIRAVVKTLEFNLKGRKKDEETALISVIIGPKEQVHRAYNGIGDEPSPMHEEVETKIKMALEGARILKTGNHNPRAVSLVITKLEEALMWLERELQQDFS